MQSKKSMIHYNQAQKQAIEHGEGPMLVLAGPGSGKTAVITGRLCRLMQNGISPSSILVVTFTRTAAAEMKGRFLSQMGISSTQAPFGTFHGAVSYTHLDVYKRQDQAFDLLAGDSRVD